jgi:SurA-like N-terminal domain
MTRPPSPTRRVASPLLAVVAAGLLAGALAGCNPAEAGAAAVVGDVRITETRVNEGAAEAAEAAATLPDTPENALDSSQFMRENANRLISSVLLTQTAAEEGIVVTQAEVDELLDQASGGQPRPVLEATVAAQLAVPPSELNEFAYDFLTNRKLGQKLVPGTDVSAQNAAARARVIQTADEVGVTVSPRYGAWDPSEGAIIGSADDLSRPLGAPPVDQGAGTPPPTGQ